MMCDIQCITFHSGQGEEYYLIHDSLTTFPVTSIERFHDSPPFSRDDVKVAINMRSGTIRDSTDVVSIVAIMCTSITNIFPKDWRSLTRENRWKKASRGRHVEIVPLVLFLDDVGGYRSKKWKKFDVWAMLLAGLPRRKNIQLHFICASNKADWLDLSKPVVDDLLLLEEGMMMYDAMYDEEVLVVAPVLCILAYNPRASELVNHLGTSARRFCRMCNVCSMLQ